MGNLMGSWRYKEPSTVEECDSTWGSDSESDDPLPPAVEAAAAEGSGGGGISESVGPAEAARCSVDPGDIMSLQVGGCWLHRWNSQCTMMDRSARSLIIREQSSMWRLAAERAG